MIQSDHCSRRPWPRPLRLTTGLTGGALRRPVALSLAVVFLFNLTLPIFTQEASAASSTTSSSTTSPQTNTTTSSTSTLSSSSGTSAPSQLSAESTAEIPITVAPGTAGAAPQVSLRYNSSILDELEPRHQGSSPGLGWTLEAGGFVLRDAKNTPSLSDDTFKLVFGGASHDLVFDSAANLYRTKDETFWRIRFDSAADTWTLTTKDGTIHRFGTTTDTRARGLDQNLNTFTYKYLLDEAVTTRGTAVRYTYTKQTGTIEGRTYDQAVYPDRITYTYHNSALVGPAREIVFLWGDRTDWNDGYFERKRLDAIEVRVNSGLVRRYAFTYDYSIDRDPGYTWEGGASGDLTLKTVTQVGTDGSTLPSLTFTYSGARLSSVSNGIGGTVSFTYERATSTTLYSAAIRYEPERCGENSCSPEVIDRGVSTGPDPWGLSTLLGYIYAGKVDRHRVTSRGTSPEATTTYTTRYSYTHLGLSDDGKEFRGHASVRMVDPRDNYADTWFHQTEALKGKQYEVQTRSNTNALFTRVINTWSTVTIFQSPTTPSDRVTFARLDQAIVETWEGGASFRQTGQTFEYDAYGNPSRVVHLGDANPSVTGDERTDITEYAYNTDKYIVGLPARNVTLDGTGATGVTLAQTWFFYDGAPSHITPLTFGNLTKRCTWFDGGTNPCVTLGYDPYGNVTASTDARGNTTTTSYDTTYHTFPERVTSPPPLPDKPPLVSTATYDHRFGVVLTSTDPNGQTTTNQYDTFGRLTTTTNPLGQTATTSYDAFGTVGSQRITVRLPDGSPDGLWSEEYFDGLGRTYLSRKKAAGGVVLQETTFDDRGLVKEKILPRFEADPPVIAAQLTYDPLGRLTETFFPADGTRETITYAIVTPAERDRFARITVTDRKGRTRTSVKDVYGRVTQITEPNNAITTYAYDPLGRLKQVTDAAGNSTTITYDTLGRKTAMTEPNMGTWSYTYDENGNLKTQTDAKGQILRFDYDTLNRLLTKTYPDGFSITYTYDTGTNGKGRRATMTDRAGTVTWSYDVLGRTASGTRTIDGVSYTSQTTYTSLGQPRTLTYPDGEVVTYTYDAGGQVFSVIGAQVYVRSMTYTAAGQLKTLQYADEITANWTYDPQTLRLSRKQSTTTALSLAPLTRFTTSWTGLPHLYAALNRGSLCVANTSGTCVGTDVKDTPGGGSLLGYMRTSADPGTLPLYHSLCYSDTSGTCFGWGLSLTPSGLVAGYLSPTAPDTTSASLPLVASGNLLFQGLSGAPSAYLWTADSVPSTLTPHTTHLYVTDGSSPSGYTAEGTTGYLHQSADPGTVALTRYLNTSTGHYYYSVSNDPPTGFFPETTLGYLHPTATPGVVPLYRYFNPTTGDYLLDTASAPSGYTLQTTLGYVHTTTTPAVLQDFSYTYDPVGNITTLTDTRTPSNSQTFEYDTLDRLKTAVGPYGTHTYQYNDIGNILTKAGVSYSYGATAQTCNRLMPHAVTATSNGKSYSYDCNGNMTSDGERTLVWDFDNMPSSVTRAGVGMTSFVYSGDGGRVKKIGPTQTIRYTGAFEDHVTDNATIKQITAGPVRVATKVTGGPNAGTYFILSDHLGGLNVLTTSSGAEVQRLSYLPFGETLSNTGTVDFHARRYTGQIQDPETGLYYYNARYYDPTLGRFLSPDSIVPNPGDSQALNRYSYVTNNPVNYTDPSGHLKVNWRKLWRGFHGRVAQMFGVIPHVINAAVMGQDIGQAARTGAIRGAIMGAGMIVGFGVGALVSWGASAIFGQMVGEFVGNVAGAFAGGFTTGAIQAGLTGGNIWAAGLKSGAIAAAVVVVIYGGVQLWQQMQSPALAEAGGPGHSPSNRHYVTDGGLRGPDASFENPTGGGLRPPDPQGSGSYMASRGGGRTHAGIDITSTPGQTVVSPFSGVAEVDPYPLGGVRITGGPYTGRALYINPNFTGQIPVQAGTPIGTALDITLIYPGITNHVHFELYLGGVGNVDPTPFIFPGR